jgi:hypothetical protein
VEIAFIEMQSDRQDSGVEEQQLLFQRVKMMGLKQLKNESEQSMSRKRTSLLFAVPFHQRLPGMLNILSNDN